MAFPAHAQARIPRSISNALRKNIHTLVACRSPPICLQHAFTSFYRPALSQYYHPHVRANLHISQKRTTIHTDAELPSRRVHLQHSLYDGTLRKKLRAGLPTVGVVTGLHNDTDHVETIGLLGYDFLWADAEHSTASPDSVASLILAAERRGMPTLVRIGYGYQNIIGHTQKYLVAGAQGIILPQCESREDVEKIVEAVKFPPLGKRGLAGERWNAWGLGEGGSLKERIQKCNQNSVVGVVIESQRGMDALDEILAVKNLDFCFVAPTDLSADMGLHGEIRHLDVIAKIDEIGAKIRAAGVSSGMLALTADDYTYWRKRGFQRTCVAHSMFVDGAQGFMKKIVKHESASVEKLRKVALLPLLLIASQLTIEESSSLQNMFTLIDENGDGCLSLKELDLAIKNDVLSSDLRKNLAGLRDVLYLTGEEYVDWKNFLAGIMDKRLALQDDRIRLVFNHIRNADVSDVSISDLTEFLDDKVVINDIMKEFDTNGDGRISFEEFRSIMVDTFSSKDL